jgi:hypothetical protein
MTGSASLTGSYFVNPTVVSGVAAKPYEIAHVRNLLPVAGTASNMVRYTVDNGGEGTVVTVAEGVTKPPLTPIP